MKRGGGGGVHGGVLPSVQAFAIISIICYCLHYSYAGVS